MAVRTFEHTVSEQDTAAVIGSGDLPVLATPRLIRWLEMASHAAAADLIEQGQTTVGTLVHVEHIKGSPVGATITITCSAPMSDGRRLIFQVAALDESGDEVAKGELHRRVIDPVRFMQRFQDMSRPDGAT